MTQRRRSDRDLGGPWFKLRLALSQWLLRLGARVASLFIALADLPATRGHSTKAPTVACVRG